MQRARSSSTPSALCGRRSKPPITPWATRPRAVRTALAAAALAVAQGAPALELDTGNPDWSVRLDNTVKGSLMARTGDADPALVNSFRLLVPNVARSAFPQALNFNAGDDNFRNKGLVSQRIDLLSEFDAVYQRNFGLRVSAAAWYDGAYSGSTDAAERVNGQTPFNAFPDSTRQLAGRKAELLDAFVFGGWELGEGRKLTARLGRHALQYGESLFFGDNGIARAQGPIDINKLLSSPNAQFKEIIRPVPQVSAQLQISPQLSVGGYYQFRWEADRLPPAGSYFSTANIPWGSSLPEMVNIPSGPIAGNYMLAAGGDVHPKDSGQFGLQLKWRSDETDIGVYAARYHDKGGQAYGALNVANPTASQWYYVFPDAIRTVGVSATRSVGEANFAIEASVRDNMPLRNRNMVYPTAFSAQPQGATGRTAHINLSWLATLGPNFIARESNFLGEIAWNRVLKTNDPGHWLDEGRTRDATAIQMIYSPSYRQILPGLDLSVPVGIRYALSGNSAITPWDAHGNGSATIGLEGNYLGVWQFALTYTRYLGKAVPFVDFSTLLTGGHEIYSPGNPLADRSHIAFTLRRTF